MISATRRPLSRSFCVIVLASHRTLNASPGVAPLSAPKLHAVVSNFLQCAREAPPQGRSVLLEDDRRAEIARGPADDRDQAVDTGRAIRLSWIGRHVRKQAQPAGRETEKAQARNQRFGRPVTPDERRRGNLRLRSRQRRPNAEDFRRSNFGSAGKRTAFEGISCEDSDKCSVRRLERFEQRIGAGRL